MAIEDWEEAAERFYNKDWRRIIEINEAELKDEPDNDFLLWETADAYISLGEYERALELGNRILESCPDNPNAEDIIKRAEILSGNVKQSTIPPSGEKRGC
jgi:tetratricopeptide (TPR) repeat protein